MLCAVKNLGKTNVQPIDEIDRFWYIVRYPVIFKIWNILLHCFLICEEIGSWSEHMYKWQMPFPCQSSKLSGDHHWWWIDMATSHRLHIQIIIESNCCYVQIKPYVTQKSLCGLCYSLVYPYLTYCNVIWGKKIQSTFDTYRYYSPTKRSSSIFEFPWL